MQRNRTKTLNPALFFFYKNKFVTYVENCATDMVRKPFDVGNEIVLIGHQQGADITLEELVEGTGFSEYQLLSQLSVLLPRYYFYKAKLQQSG